MNSDDEYILIPNCYVAPRVIDASGPLMVVNTARGAWTSPEEMIAKGWDQVYIRVEREGNQLVLGG